MMRKTMRVLKAAPDHTLAGALIATDLLSVRFEDGEKVTLTGRAHVGSGVWNLWNSDSGLLITATEVAGEN